MLTSTTVDDSSYSVCCLNAFLDKLSLGDARAYYLSTAKNELGVVSAESPAGKGFFFASF